MPPLVTLSSLRLTANKYFPIYLFLMIRFWPQSIRFCRFSFLCLVLDEVRRWGFGGRQKKRKKRQNISDCGRSLTNSWISKAWMCLNKRIGAVNLADKMQSFSLQSSTVAHIDWHKSLIRAFFAIFLRDRSFLRQDSSYSISMLMPGKSSLRWFNTVASSSKTPGSFVLSKGETRCLWPRKLSGF